MFQIESFIEARLATVTNRIDKHGDDEVPAVSLGIEITTANTILDCIDPQLRHALYKAVDAQEPLPGIEPATPVLRANSIERTILTTSHEGWTLEVDDGIDDTTPMTFGSCKVDKFSVEAKQGGSIVLRLRIGTSDVDAHSLGQLGMHVGQSIWVTLTAPKVTAPAIDGTTEAFKRDHPDAADLFAGSSAEESGETESEGGETDVDAGETLDGSGETIGSDGETLVDASADLPVDETPDLQEPERGTNWPFPSGGAKTDAEAREMALTAAGAAAAAGAGPEVVQKMVDAAPKGRRSRKAGAAVE